MAVCGWRERKIRVAHKLFCRGLFSSFSEDDGIVLVIARVLYCDDRVSDQREEIDNDWGDAMGLFCSV